MATNIYLDGQTIHAQCDSYSFSRPLDSIMLLLSKVRKRHLAANTVLENMAVAEKRLE
jgi:hypothetical protein